MFRYICRLYICVFVEVSQSSVGFHPSSSFRSGSLYHPFVVSSFFWLLRSCCTVNSLMKES